MKSAGSTASPCRESPAKSTRRAKARGPDVADFILLGTAALVAAGGLSLLALLLF